jgi:hypothetical protein
VFRPNYRNGLGASLIAVIVACALWIGYLAIRGGHASVESPQPADQTAKLEEIRLAPDYAGPAGDLAAATARPLFNASRRPPAGAATAGSGSSALPRGRYTLTGVSISPDKREALLHEVATNTTVRVEQNRQVNGLLVESVTPTKVTLKLGAEREEIPLKIAPAPKLAAATTPKPDQAGQEPSPRVPSPATPFVPTPPAAAAAPGPPQAAADIANADPITDADIAEREARVRARRERQSSSREGAPR